MLKELLDGSGPPVYRIAGKLYVDEKEARRWLAGKRARLDPPRSRLHDDERLRTFNDRYARAMTELAGGKTDAYAGLETIGA